jgi:hypothetical protein
MQPYYRNGDPTTVFRYLIQREKSFDKMVVKQLHNRQTNGTENETPGPANPKPHKNRENVYFTSKQKENIDKTYLKVLNTPNPSRQLHMHIEKQATFHTFENI